ncbi:hypothetical protein F5887DRAFT_1178530 [Amanita rubescens]|nr:hypothetical protein F5887DRAFT_1178530 [Amanita rubescens]
MPDDTVRVLRCLVKGATIPMKVSPSVDDDVDDLKAMVHERGKNGILRDTDIQDLFVWKLKNQESLIPEESLGDRVFSQGPLSTIAVKLESSARIGDIFKDQPKLGLHIVVQLVPSPTISPSSSLTSNISAHASSTGPAASIKRARSPSAQGGDEAKKMRPTIDTDSVLMRLVKLHTHLWGENRFVYIKEMACSILHLALFDILNLNARPDNILLVRNEYLLAYDHIASNTLKNPTTKRLRSATLVTGQPGIGKTLFLFYVLARRLHERKPVAFQISPDEFALFGQDGVSLHPAGRGPGCVPEDTWALSDSDPPGVQTGLCIAFLQPAFHVIHTSSPSSSRWKNWVKRLGADKYIMDVWSLGELQTLLALNNLDFVEGKDLFEKYGPSPRIIIYILTGRIKKDRYESEVNTAAAKLAGEFSVVFPQLENLDSSAEISSKIFTVKPKKSMSRGVHALEIPTQFLCRTFGLAMSRQTAAQQHTFFRMLNGHPTFEDNRFLFGLIGERSHDT